MRLVIPGWYIAHYPPMVVRPLGDKPDNILSLDISMHMPALCGCLRDITSLRLHKIGSFCLESIEQCPVWVGLANHSKGEVVIVAKILLKATPAVLRSRPDRQQSQQCKLGFEDVRPQSRTVYAPCLKSPARSTDRYDQATGIDTWTGCHYL